MSAWRRPEPLAAAVPFGLLVAASAILIDAAVAHGWFWQNDPYWTYWVSKTVLVAVVFSLGAALLGRGLAAGAVTTLAHTAILETYYEWVAPITLPQEHHWVPFHDLWVVGFAAHAVTVFAGFAIARALVSWRRPAGSPQPPTGRTVLACLLGAASAVAVDVTLSHVVMLGEPPGWTYAIQHFDLAVLFLLVWSWQHGPGRPSLPAGAFLLALVWTTYSMYLSALHLPGPRPSYMTSVELWAAAFPGGLAAAAAGIAVLAVVRDRAVPRLTRASWRAVPLLLVAAALAGAAPFLLGPKDVAASASGSARMVVGPDPVDLGSTRPAQGTFTFTGQERSDRWSALQGLDEVHLRARWTSAGRTYEVRSDLAMPHAPDGRTATWMGVALAQEMHGGTGVGTAGLPKMMPELAVWGWGNVTIDGVQEARMVAVHAMVMRHGPVEGVLLEVGLPERSLPAGEGYLTVHWQEARSVDLPGSFLARQAVGLALLAGLAASFLLLASRSR